MTSDAKTAEAEALKRLQEENTRLTEELNVLNNSLRLRAADTLAAAFRNPRELLRLPKALLEFYRHARTVRQWRKIVVGLECGLPEDPLRRIAAAELRSDATGALLPSIYGDKRVQLRQDASPALRYAEKRIAELNAIRKNGPPFFGGEDTASPVAPASNKHVLMALHAGEPDLVNGYTRRSQELLLGLRDLGWNIAAAIRQGRSGAGPLLADAETNGVPYLRLPAFSSDQHSIAAYIEAYAGAIEKKARDYRPALIHAASNHITGAAAAIAAKRAGLPFIYEVRGLWEVTRETVEPAYADSIGYQAQHRLEIETAKQADRVLVNGAALGAFFEQAGIEKEKIRIAPNGCAPEMFDATDQDIEPLKRAWRIDDRPVIGFVGSITPYEGLHDLVRAFKKLPPQAYQLLLVGDGPARRELEGFAAKHLPAGAFRFTGNVSPDDARRAYGLIDIAAYARPNSPVAALTPPLKPLEAMCAGAALVLSDAAGLADFAAEGRAAIAPSGDVAALTQVLHQLLNNPEKRKAMTRAAKTWAEENRRWSDIAKSIAGVYDELIG